jgi:hypothetical protein
MDIDIRHKFMLTSKDLLFLTCGKGHIYNTLAIIHHPSHKHKNGTQYNIYNVGVGPEKQ